MTVTKSKPMVGAKTKRLLSLLYKAGIDPHYEEVGRLAKGMRDVPDGEMRLADGEFQVRVGEEWITYGTFKNRFLNFETTHHEAKPAHAYHRNGLERVDLDTGAYEKWTGQSWRPDGTHVRSVEEWAQSNGKKRPDVDQSKGNTSPMGRSRTALEAYVDDGVTVYVASDGSLGLGVVEIIKTPTGRDVWLDQQTLERIESNPKLDEQFHKTDVERWEPGMKYLMEDVSYTSFFKDAVRREETEKRLAEAEKIEVDALEELQRKANALLVQVAEYNAAPSPTLTAAFGARLGDMQAELDEAAEKVAQIKEILALAGVALMETSS